MEFLDAAPTPHAAIPHIPTDIALPFILTAIRWVGEYGPDIAAAKDLCDAAYLGADWRDMHKTVRELRARDALRAYTFRNPPEIGGRRLPVTLTRKQDLNKLTKHLIEACYIVVAALTGMRISELLSLEVGCLLHESLDDGSGGGLLYVRGTLIKTSGSPDGQPERWVAGLDGPGNHVRTAITLLERLSADFRRRSGERHLFLSVGPQARGLPSTPGGTSINERINQFAQAMGTTRPWVFSSHQFRKTFARFVALGDKSGLLALKQHFKHISVAMTDRYVGVDFDLVDLIASERQDEMARALDSLLASEHLAGRMGTHIAARNQRFRGRAGSEVRREYVRMVLTETDLTIVPHEYGVCVYQEETARCGGKLSRVGLSACASCANFAVAPEHTPFWERHRAAGLRLLDDVMDLPGREGAREALRAMVNEAETVLARIARLVGGE